MKKSKVLIGMMILLITSLMYGCGGKTPTNTVEEYFKRVQKGESNAEELFADASGEASEEDQFSEEVSKKMLTAVSKLTYKVNSETITGDTAIVNVSVNGADLSMVMANVMQEAFTFAFSQAFSGEEMTQEESDEYFNNLFIEKLEEVTYTDRTGDILLVKVDGEWVISEDDSLATLVIGLNPSMFDDIE